MSKPLPHLTTVVTLCALACCTTRAATETQTFDSAASAAAAGWFVNDEGMNPLRDCADCATDLGWKDTNHAGGAKPGEAGGQLHRSGNLPIGFYGDITIGKLTLDMPFMAKGKLALIDEDFDGHAHLGFFDGVRLKEDPLDFGANIGFLIAEPGGGVDPNFRWGPSIHSDFQTELQNNTAFLFGLPDSEPMDFSIEYDPAGGAGFGLLTLSIADEDPVDIELTEQLRTDGGTFTAFGIHTGPFLGSADQRKMQIFIDDVTYTSEAGPVGPPGDFNGSGELDAEDIDLLSAEVRKPEPDRNTRFDLNTDTKVNRDDRTVWIKDLRKTWVGDANLDGEFNSGDFVQVFQIGEYEDALAGNSTWAEGDWDGDSEFDSGDFVVAFQDGGFERGLRAGAAAVPEPTTATLVILGLCGLARLRRFD